jgi:two-component system sensor histidine kinase KdpD
MGSTDQLDQTFKRARVFGADGILYWNTLWLLFGIGFTGSLLQDVIGYRSVGFLFLIGVLIVGFFGELGPVLFAATLSALAWNFFFIPPRFTFSIGSAEDIFLLVTFFFAAIATGLLANRVKRQEMVIKVREERTHLLYEVMLDISGSKSQSGFLQTITKRISSALNGKCNVLLRDKTGSLEKPLEFYSSSILSEELEVATWTFDHSKVSGWSTHEFETAKALYYPIRGESQTVGILSFEPNLTNEITNLSLDQENLLQSVCKHLGISLERHFIEGRLREGERLRESEKLHQTLLNSISHEIRTPLTAILASASALEDAATLQNADQRGAFGLTLRRASERLNRVIENLLDMSRLNTGGIALKKEWHDPVDLVGVTVSRLKENFNFEVPVQIEPGIPLIEIDFRLMEHVLFNLLVNAITYSLPKPEVSLRIGRSEDSIYFLVEDSGPGIPQEFHERIFEKFFRVPGSPPGGTGLGLSIAKSIVDFHLGSISVTSKRVGGAKFTVRLPVAKPPNVPAENV